MEEYIEVSSLEELLNHQWSMENILIFLWDILSILQLLHRQNIVHRDIKPSNLIQRNKDNKFTIIDFGAVKEINVEQQEKGTCIYHKGYAPIEQMQGIPQLNSDIYALGMTAIQLLTREPPRELIRDEDEVTNKNNKNPALWSDRGFVLLQLNRPQDAFASYDRALMLNENFYEALIGKANAYNLVKDYQQALVWFDRALEIRPQDYQVWYNRGNLQLQGLNNPTEALKSFQKATTINPDFYPAWLGQGFSFNALEKYPDAKSALNTAMKFNSRDPYAWFNLGLALEALGELQSAYDAYHKAVELNFSPAQEYLSQMELRLGL